MGYVALEGGQGDLFLAPDKVGREVARRSRDGEGAARPGSELAKLAASGKIAGSNVQINVKRCCAPPPPHRRGLCQRHLLDIEIV